MTDKPELKPRRYICGIFANPRHTDECPECNENGELLFMIGKDCKAACLSCNVEWSFKIDNTRTPDQRKSD